MLFSEPLQTVVSRQRSQEKIIARASYETTYGTSA
jgi:hypothetical protein